MFRVHITAMDNRFVNLRLASGLLVHLRPIRPQDRSRIEHAVAQMSDHSRYLRFFNGARTLPPAIIDRLVNVDGNKHIAWGAMDIGGNVPKAIGAVHVVRADDKSTADLALAVLDDYHGQGLARLLLTAVVTDCLEKEITTLTADTLSENRKAKTLFRSLGGLSKHSEGAVVKYRFSAATMYQRLTRDHASHDTGTLVKKLDDYKQAARLAASA